MKRPLVRRVTLLAGLVLGTLVVRGAGCRSAQRWHPRDATPEACASCHQDVAAEWVESAHAVAWTSPSFRAASDDYAQADCLGCHAPSSVLSGDGPPSVRPWRREAGVDCQTCHLDDEGRLVGPLEPERNDLLQAHEIRREGLLYRSSELCGRCHEEALAQVEAFALEPERRGLVPTCQQCHMPVVVRSMTQGGDATTQVGEALGAVRRQRRHTFGLTLESWERAEQLELTLEAPKAAGDVPARGTLHNGLPHAVPVGREKTPSRVVLRLTGFDASGAETGREDRVFDVATPLAPGETAILETTLPSGTKRVTLQVVREHASRPPQELRRVELGTKTKD